VPENPVPENPVPENPVPENPAPHNDVGLQHRARHLCIHGHFYQPPRESPWLETVEVQDSASPYHDWNQRVTAECYAPNTCARILDQGRIARIVNNYSRISFDFGPTLLSWLERADPEVYDALLQANRASAERFSGHGSALAQAHSHLIMPLASSRDKRTQITWGRRDFEGRFGRAPEGMWLPETAVDLETLELLAEQGIRFTILAPHQAKRVRPLQTRRRGEWQDVAGQNVDPTMPYLCRLPSRKEIALFFYDGPISRAVAFENLLGDGYAFAERLITGYHDHREGAQLMHIATDGETYGHHHRYGDMALAWALEYLDRRDDVHLTNYGEFLERNPPTHEVEIAEDTSWSCIHGVERWRSDCGCHTGGDPGWHQRWREPLRAALDWLHDRLDEEFERSGARLFGDPWAAREDYVDVLLDRRREQVEEWLSRHARGGVDDESRRRMLTLLEMQRHAMYMTTSCGWFFNEISGIETVQVLRYAARGLQLAAQVSPDRRLEDDFVERLAQAESNVPRFRDGRGVWEQAVRPLRLELKQIAAHYAVSSLFDQRGETDQLFCYNVRDEEARSWRTGRAALAVGVAEVRSELTAERGTFSYGVLHFGDHHITGGVREWRGGHAFEELAGAVKEAFDRVDFTEIVRQFDHYLEELTFSLASLFADEQRRVVGELLDATLNEVRDQYRRIYEHHAPLMRFVAQLGMPIPEPFRVAARTFIEHDLEARLAQLEQPPEQIVALFEQAADLDLELDRDALELAVERSVLRLARELAEQPAELERLDRLGASIDLLRELPLWPDLWETANLYYELALGVYPQMRERADEDEVAAGWVQRFEKLGDDLGFKVPLASLEPVGAGA
jgi:alpha-amylase/alpha-mannosidase (GH57 family)